MRTCKKIIICAMMISSVTMMSGCDEDIKPAQTKEMSSVKPEIDLAKIQSDKAIVKVENLNIQFIEIREPDSHGNVEMVHVITNNSDYEVSSVNLTVEFDDELNYMSYQAPIMAGQSSEWIASNGPKTLKPEDIQRKTLSVVVPSEDGDLYIEYDYETEQYEVIK